ncbi:MAG: hypothetical protein H0X26_00265 [Alphaproteobacteria bacterium]|nr:hypothetical protein [Alphaproteobacteria bacterium]
MKIQIMKIYSESFQNVRSHKREWIRVAYAPILIWALGALFLGFAYMSDGHSFKEVPTEFSTFLTFGGIVFALAYFIAMMSLHINGYRYAILQEGGRSWITLNLNMRFLKMVLYLILISLLAGIYALISAGIIIGAHALFESVAVDVILGILLGLYGFYLMFRLVLYPVAISIDQSQALTTSWSLLKGNVLRVVGLLLLIGLTISVITFVLGLVVGLINILLGFGGPILASLSIVLSVLQILFMILLGWAVNAKAMGLVYLELSGKKVAALKKK